ncbi:hypothetical protein [Desulfovibrio sp. UCD-KL4C]|uniref:hypothetical protein n=1 Tax=Desulfovibrio sp. UCD-KL4C TaxID=2578120 RepID=UPI0025C5984D|nr:hypothetical protein [Desulfovibrio sp. UCD-KL4C]
MRTLILIFSVFILSSCTPGYLEIQKRSYAQLNNFKRKENLTNFAVKGVKRSDVIDMLGMPDVKKELHGGKKVAVYHRKATSSEKFAMHFSQESYIIYYNMDDVIEKKIVLKDDEFNVWKKINVDELLDSNNIETINGSFYGVLTLDLMSIDLTKEKLRNGKAILEPIYVFNGNELVPNWDLTKLIHSNLSKCFNMCSFSETQRYHHLFTDKLKYLEKMKDFNQNINDSRLKKFKKGLSSASTYNTNYDQLEERMKEFDTQEAAYYSGKYNIYDTSFYKNVISGLTGSVDYVISPNCSQFDFYTVVLQAYSKKFQNIKTVNVESANAGESKIAFYDIEAIKKITSKGVTNPMFAMSSFFAKSRNFRRVTQLTKDNVSFLVKSLQKLNVTSGIKSTTLE